MRLGILTDCTHYKTPDGKVATENHILLRQFQELCSYYSATMICCPFAEDDGTKVLTTYADGNIQFYALPLRGGMTLKAKTKLLTTIPTWLKAFKTIDNFSDVLYQRFPNNLNIPGFFYFWLKGKKTFATYTGTWCGFKGEPATYRLQRWLLINFFKGPVWVYAVKNWRNGRIHEGYSPSYNFDEWEEEILQVEQRITKIENVGIPELRLITVGSLTVNKNQHVIIRACKMIKAQNIPFHLTIVGDGVMRADLEKLVAENNLLEEVTFTGKKKYQELRDLYRQNDFVVQSPLTEGFGKVPIEGFFHGLIPVINSVSMAFSITGNGERGFLFDAADPANLADVLVKLQDKVGSLPGMIRSGREYAKKHTLKSWAQEYYEEVSKFYL